MTSLWVWPISNLAKYFYSSTNLSLYENPLNKLAFCINPHVFHEDLWYVVEVYMVKRRSGEPFRWGRVWCLENFKTGSYNSDFARFGH